MEDYAVVIKDAGVKLGSVQVLRHMDAVIPRGACTAVIGPNGAGKTSLALALAGQEPYSGEILFPGHKSRQTVRFGFVPQKLQFDRDMPMTVQDFLLAGIQRRPLFLGASGRGQKIIRQVLADVECETLADRTFGVLSGGEIQRVLLAAALLRDPEILILDEPTSGVDVKGGRLCCELLHRIRQKQHFTQIMISHDLATVAAHADHVICIRGTVIAQGAPKKILTHDVLSRTFGIHLGIPDPELLAENVQFCDTSCPHHTEHAGNHPERTNCQCHHHEKGRTHHAE